MWPAPFSCHACIELFLLNILDIFSGKNLMKKNIWHFIIFGKMNGPNQTPLPLTPGWLKVLPMGLCYIKAYFYWKIGRASKTNSNKLCCVLPNLKPKVRPYISGKNTWSFFSIGILQPLKVSKSQNKFMMSSFLPKYKRNILRISALGSKKWVNQKLYFTNYVK